MKPIKLTLRASRNRIFEMWVDTAEDGVEVLIDGKPLIAIDMHYCGLPIGSGDDEVPEDPEDPANTPKVVVGAWPDGEQWERVYTLALGPARNETAALDTPTGQIPSTTAVLLQEIVGIDAAVDDIIALESEMRMRRRRSVDLSPRLHKIENLIATLPPDAARPVQLKLDAVLDKMLREFWGK